MVPQWITGYAKTLGPEGIAVYTVLCIHADKNGRCYPALPTIAAESGVSRSTAALRIKLLQKLGIISVESGGGRRKVNVYHLKTVRQTDGLEDDTVRRASETVRATTINSPSAGWEQIHGTDPLTEDLERKKTIEALDRVRSQMLGRTIAQ